MFYYLHPHEFHLLPSLSLFLSSSLSPSTSPSLFTLVLLFRPHPVCRKTHSRDRHNHYSDDGYISDPGLLRDAIHVSHYEVSIKTNATNNINYVFLALC